MSLKISSQVNLVSELSGKIIFGECFCKRDKRGRGGDFHYVDIFQFLR